MTARGNEIIDVDFDGIQIEGDNVDAELTNNTISGSDRAAFNVRHDGASLADVRLNWNNIVGNDVGVDATENWWGDDDGPSGEGDGDGDAVTENVSYVPYLNAEAPDGLPIYPISPIDSSSE